MMDDTMVQAVYEVMRDSFLKNKGQRDIQIMAAERIAIDLLADAWKELLKFKKSDKNQPTLTKQVGL